jgi:uncharacterized protein YjiS (DUF1127 family)
MRFDPESGTAANPSGGHLVRAVVASIGIDRRLGGPIRRLVVFIPTWLAQGAERRRLRSLSDHMLKDIGVSRRDVEREARARWYGN